MEILAQTQLQYWIMDFVYWFFAPVWSLADVFVGYLLVYGIIFLLKTGFSIFKKWQANGYVGAASATSNEDNQDGDTQEEIESFYLVDTDTTVELHPRKPQPTKPIKPKEQLS